MSTHTMKLSRGPFDKIASGQKVIESRLFDEKRQQINIGDIIEFTENDNTVNIVTTKVKALHRYTSFDELFTAFPPQLFGGKSKEDLLQEIHQFYSPEDEAMFGVVGIRIEKT